MEKESYKARPIKRKKFVDFRTKLKNRLKYKKNRLKIKMYNKKWRQKNKLLLKRKQKLRRLRKK